MYVYRFLNKDNNIIYIGRTKNIKNRINTHNHLPEGCYKEIDRIEYTTFANNDESAIYERYYINKYSPKYNIEYNNNSEFTFSLPSKKWKIYNKMLLNKHSFCITNEDIDLTDADLGKLIRLIQKGLVQGNILCNKKDVRSSFMTKHNIKDILNIEIKAVERFLKRLRDKKIITYDGKKYIISENILTT